MKTLITLLILAVSVHAAPPPPTVASFNIQGMRNGTAFNIPIADVTLTPHPMYPFLQSGAFNAPELAKLLGDDPNTDAAFTISIGPGTSTQADASFGVSNRLQHGLSSPGLFKYTPNQPIILQGYGSITFK